METTKATTRRIPLCEAEPLAAELETLLEPACVRIEIAGSIRRRAAEVKDIELVCVPRLVPRGGDEKLLFPLSEADETLDLASAVDGRVETLCGAQAVDLRYDTLKPANGSRQKRLLFHGVQVDLFILIPPADWGVMFTLRTGPAIWSKRLVTNRKYGGLLPDRMAVCGGGQLVESRQARRAGARRTQLLRHLRPDVGRTPPTHLRATLPTRTDTQGQGPCTWCRSPGRSARSWRMKFRMRVRTVGKKNDGWWEEYERTCADAEVEARSIIEFFNSTLKPRERPRELLEVRVTDERIDGPQHDWEKSNWITRVDRDGTFDRYRCRKCGITGKRRQLGGAIVRDSKFRAKLFEDCRKAAAKLKKETSSAGAV